jgi:hypothetical protein
MSGQPEAPYGAPQHESPLHDAVHDLVGDVQSPEDMQVLDEWMKEADTERADALKAIGANTLKPLVERPDGTITTKEQVDAEHEAGQEGSSAYGTSNRRD